MTNTEKSFQVRDLRQKQRFVVDDAYLNGFARLLGPYASMVYFTLCRHADSRFQSCFPSIPLIAEKLGISQRQVMRSIRKLQEHNIIRIEKRPRHNGNIYHLLDKAQWTRGGASSDSQSLVTHSHPSSDSQSLVLVTHSHPKDTQVRKHKKETTTTLVVLPLAGKEKDVEEKDTASTTPLDQFTNVTEYLAEYPELARRFGDDTLLRALAIARHNDPSRDLSARNGAGAYLRGICQFGAVLPRELRERPAEDPKRTKIREMLQPGAELTVEGNTCVVDAAGGVVVGRAAIPREMLIDMVLAGAACVVNAKEKEETHAN